MEYVTKPFNELPKVTEIEVKKDFTFTRTKEYRVKGSYKTLTVIGCDMGCGIVQLNGIANFEIADLQELKDILSYIEYTQKPNGDYGVNSCAIALLGDGYSRYFPYMKKLGFKQVETYVNRWHSPTYKSRLYTYVFSPINKA